MLGILGTSTTTCVLPKHTDILAGQNFCYALLYMVDKACMQISVHTNRHSPVGNCFPQDHPRPHAYQCSSLQWPKYMYMHAQQHILINQKRKELRKNCTMFTNTRIYVKYMQYPHTRNRARDYTQLVAQPTCNYTWRTLLKFTGHKDHLIIMHTDRANKLHVTCKSYIT